MDVESNGRGNEEIEHAVRHFRATNLDVIDVTAETFR